MRLRASEAVGAALVFATTLAAAAIVLASLWGCSADGGGTWPESVEFSTLESGQKRWSRHDTGEPSLDVVVDRSTGVEYLLYDDGPSAGLCPLLDADGSPLRVLEAGS